MDLASHRRARAGSARGSAASRRRHPAWRVVRALAIAVCSAYLLYLGVANALLGARVLPDHLDDAEEGVRIAYDAAWTLWPGRVSVEGLRVASQDSTIELEIRAPEASARVSLLALLDRTVELSRVRASHVSVRVRGRRPEVVAVAEQAMLPPMVTWGPLALEPVAPPTPSNPDELWHIVLDDVEGSVDEVWVEGVRVTGDIRVRGGFDFRPLVNVIVDDVRGVVRDGVVEAMGTPRPGIAEGIDGAFRFHVPAFDVPSHELPEIVAAAEVDVDATGLLAGDAVASALSDEVTVTDGSGAFRVHAAARRGRFVRGSRVDVEVAHLGVNVGAPRADVTDAVVVARATSDDEVVVAAAAANADVGVPPARVHVEAPSATVTIGTRPSFLEPALEGGEVSVPAANLDLGPLDRVVPAVRVRRGIAFLRGEATFDRDGKGSGSLHARVESLEGAVLGVGITGRARADVRLDELRVGANPAVRSRAFVTLDDVAVDAGDERVTGWWGRLEVGGRLERTGEAPWAIDAQVLGRLRDAHPAVAILDGGGFVPGVVADQLTAEGLVVEGGLTRRGDRLQLDVTDATGDGLRVRGRMVRAGEDLRASYLVETSLVDVGVSLVRGETQVQLLAGEGWLERERRFLLAFGWAPGQPPARN